MTRAQRKAHGVVWIVLAVLLAAGFAVALRHRAVTPAADGARP